MYDEEVHVEYVPSILRPHECATNRAQNLPSKAPSSARPHTMIVHSDANVSQLEIVRSQSLMCE